MDPIKFLRPAPFALLALLALPCSLALAEDKPATETTRSARGEPHLISIDFPGGPFSKLVASLNKDELSLIQSAGLDPVLPAFSVREVRVDGVIAALGRLLAPQGFMLDPVGNNLAVLTKFERHTSQAFGSFQLEGKINARAGRTVEDVITAIQQGCEFANPDGKPSTLRFKYHPGTKLLFVAGTEQQVDVAHRVFGSLPNSPAKEPASSAPPDKK